MAGKQLTSLGAVTKHTGKNVARRAKTVEDAIPNAAPQQFDKATEREALEYRIPADVFQSLISLHKTGRASIRGITFDLCPDQLVRQGWQSRTHVCLDMGGWTGPLLRFPWKRPKSEDFHDEVWTDIHVGDHIYVHDIETRSCGGSLDHPADQKMRVVTLAIRRGERTIILNEPIEYLKEGTFSSRMGIAYADAIKRVNNILGVEEPQRDQYKDDGAYSGALDEYGEALEQRPRHRDEKEWEYAKRANYANFHGLDSTIRDLRISIQFRKITGHEGDDQAFDRSMHEILERFADAATSIGYWLAKAEFSPHVQDTLVGKKRRDVSKQAGQVRAAQKIEEANAKWRTEALHSAIALRQKLPHLGQKALADRLIGMLRGPDEDIPECDTIIRQIRQWEKSGALPRSSSNRTPPMAKGGGS